MIHIVDFGSSKTQAISDIVKEFGYENQILKWNSCSEKDFQKSSGIILSGAPVLLTKVDYSSYIEKFKFLKNVSIPVLGICFGHQLIGILFGATVFMGKEIRNEVRIKVLKRDSIFNELPENFIMKEDHTEGIDLPKRFVYLACSDDYEVEAMKHQSKNIYGIQFHPEVSDNNGKTIMENFLALTFKKQLDFNQ